MENKINRIPLKWKPANEDYYCRVCECHSNIEFAKSAIGTRWLCMNCAASGIMGDQFMSDYPVLAKDNTNIKKRKYK